MRGKESRTHQLCMDYLEKFLRAKKEEDWQIEELDLNSMDIQPLTGESLARRDFLSRDKKFDDDEFALANQMIEADHVLIGAPDLHLQPAGSAGRPVQSKQPHIYNDVRKRDSRFQLWIRVY